MLSHYDTLISLISNGKTNLSDLNTASKASLVSAINELKSSSAPIDRITQRNTDSFIQTINSGSHFQTTRTINRCYQLLSVVTSVNSRVRIYADSISQTTDVSRSIGSDPNDNVAIFWESVGTNVINTKGAIAFNFENNDNSYITVTNLTESNANIATTILYIPIQ